MIGIDLIEIKRIEKSLKNPHFLEKVFSEKEQAIILRKNHPAETAAGRFCVKEAFGKALGTGVRGFELSEVETLNDELGCPYIVLYGKAKEIFNAKFPNAKISVSISHTAEHATAVLMFG
jgi:holo-[acyl-carrier protein] synthase